MKKLLFILLVLTHANFSIAKDFNFQLNSMANSNIYYQLINLEKLNSHKISFSWNSLESEDAETTIATWQAQLAKVKDTMQDNEGGYDFSTADLQIDVDYKLIKTVSKLLQKIDEDQAIDSKLKLYRKIEVIEAFNENFRSSNDGTYDIILSIPSLIKMALSGRGTFYPDENTNISVQPSSFWQPPTPLNMWQGKSQVDFESVAKQVCDYDGPKTGFGIQSGFKIKCGDLKFKSKFGNEVHAGPFNARIYARLGYNVPGMHYIPELKVHYSRKLFTEINSRKKKYRTYTLLGIRLRSTPDNRHKDAMNLVKSATLKTGEVIDLQTLKEKLLPNCSSEYCSNLDANFNADFESQIDYLSFIESAVIEDTGKSIGRWSYDNLDHADRREVRALLILGAWTGNYDLRKDNTKLVLQDSGELKHFISDIGSGLGGANGDNASGVINKMSWQAVTVKADGHISLTGFKAKPNKAFSKVKYDDAKWMVELIAGISENEITQALAATGLSSAEIILAREKLISMQQNMIEAFDLKSKYPERFRPIHRDLSFDPNKDVLQVQMPDGQLRTMDNRGIILVNGSLI